MGRDAAADRIDDQRRSLTPAPLPSGRGVLCAPRRRRTEPRRRTLSCECRVSAVFRMRLDIGSGEVCAPLVQGPTPLLTGERVPAPFARWPRSGSDPLRPSPYQLVLSGYDEHNSRYRHVAISACNPRALLDAGSWHLIRRCSEPKVLSQSVSASASMDRFFRLRHWRRFHHTRYEHRHFDLAEAHSAGASTGGRLIPASALDPSQTKKGAASRWRPRFIGASAPHSFP